MSMKKVVTSSFVAGAVALAISGAANTEANAADKEKCYGVVKAGHNDCGDADGKHSCMGQATVDGDPKEWIALPAGVCEKLVGGSLVAGEGGAKAGCEGKDGCEGKNGCEGKEDG